MQNKDDISYGVVPLIKENDQWLVFLIHQHGHTGDLYWTFPKGHAEGDESGEQSALRELFEEARLHATLHDTSKTYGQTYSFPHDGYTINKKVVYYVGIADSKEFVVQEEEVSEAGWYTFDEAYQQLSYERSKAMLLEVRRDLEN